MLKKLTHYLKDFFNLFFPPICLACEKPMDNTDDFICLNCHFHLPQIDFLMASHNAMIERFEGRIPFQSGAALYYFTKKSRTQHLIHHIKYKDKREAAILLGKKLGNKMKEMSNFQNFDMIIPVPMHPRKKILRGYNQAELVAEGLSMSLHVQVNNKVLIKKRMTDSQTKKSRLQRLQNIEDVFELNTPSVLEGKNILIVDDVLTTGATLEACAMAILEKTQNVKMSIATLAFAK